MTPHEFIAKWSASTLKEPLPLEKADVDTVLAAADLDWSEIDPSILGTLFERGLDPGKRAQLGAHYTDRDKIMLIVEPVVIRPWLAAWASEKRGIDAELERADAAKSPAARTRRRREAERRYRAFLDRLRTFTVPAEADLVCYWFAKAGRQLALGRAVRAGFVATSSIRGGANRRALQAAIGGGRIFEAWSDEPWVIDGAAVRVSVVCFSPAGGESDPARGPAAASRRPARLDGRPADEIFTDLTASRRGAGVDLTRVRRLPANAGAAFMGDTKGGPFRRSGRSGARMAPPAGQPERPDQRRRPEAVDERHGPDAPPGGQVDRRFRVDPVRTGRRLV